MLVIPHNTRTLLCSTALSIAFIALSPFGMSQFVIVEEAQVTKAPSINWTEALDFDITAISSEGASISRSTIAANFGLRFNFLDDRLNLSFIGYALDATTDIRLSLDEYSMSVRNEAEAALATTCNNASQSIANYSCQAWEDRISKPQDDAGYAAFHANYLGLPDERSVTLSSDTVRLSEFFVNYVANDAASLTAGTFTQSVGQFTFLSPVQLLMPIKLIPDTTKYDKSALLLEQDWVKAEIYPFGNLQLTLASSGKARYDTILDSWANNAFNTGVSTYYGTDNEPFIQPTFDEGSAESQSQSLLRAVYTGAWGSVGFTSYKGVEATSTALSNATLQRQVEQELPINALANPNTEAAFTKDFLIRYRKAFEGNSIQLHLSEKDSIGLEFRYSLTPQTSVIFEMTSSDHNVSADALFSSETLSVTCRQTYAQNEVELDSFGIPLKVIDNYSQDDCSTPLTAMHTNSDYIIDNSEFSRNGFEAQLEYADYLFANNSSAISAYDINGVLIEGQFNASELVPVTTNISGIGIEKISDVWSYSISLIHYQQEISDSNIKAKYDAKEFAQNGEEPQSSGTFPSMLFDRAGSTFGRPSHLTFGLGFFGSATGLFSSWSGEPSAGVTVNLGLEFIVRSGDQQAEDDADTTAGNYELSSSFTPSFLLGINYKF